MARLPDLLFAVALALHALPPLVLRRFPTQDGPLHMENVAALLSRGEVDVYRSFLVQNWGLQPNWLTQLLYAALCQVVSPLWAQRLVLTGAILLLPLAVRFALPRTRRGAPPVEEADVEVARDRPVLQHLADAPFEEVRVPARLLIGDKEVIYPPQATLRKAARMMPGLQTCLVPGANHIAGISNPEEINRQIIAAFQGVW